MIETLRPGTKSLNLRVTTIDLLECSNYEIEHSNSISEDQVVASIDNLQAPETCQPGLVQATSDISIGALENGSYAFQLNLENGSVVNDGTLTINDEQYSVVLDTDHGIDFPIKNLNKIQDKHVWGEINVASDVPDNVIEEILEAFYLLGEASNLAPGNYGYFTIENDLEIDFDSNKFISFSAVKTKPFIFKLPGTLFNLTVALENYRNTYDGKVDIQIMTSEGDVL